MKSIDLFAGAGGLSCGLKQAGFLPLLANELVPQYAETYKLNHPDTEMLVGDVRAKNKGSALEYGNFLLNILDQTPQFSITSQFL